MSALLSFTWRKKATPKRTDSLAFVISGNCSLDFRAASRPVFLSLAPHHSELKNNPQAQEEQIRLPRHGGPGTDIV